MLHCGWSTNKFCKGEKVDASERGPTNLYHVSWHRPSDKHIHTRTNWTRRLSPNVWRACSISVLANIFKVPLKALQPPVGLCYKVVEGAKQKVAKSLKSYTPAAVVALSPWCSLEGVSGILNSWWRPKMAVEVISPHVSCKIAQPQNCEAGTIFQAGYSSHVPTQTKNVHLCI